MEIDKGEIYASRLRETVRSIEDLRVEIYQNSTDEEKKETDDFLFKYQSNLRDIALCIEFLDSI